MKRKYLLSFVLLITLLTTFLLPTQSMATSWAYPFVVWKGFIYVVSDEYVTNVEKEIGKVTKYSDMDSYRGNFSNVYRKGTKYYSINGISTDEAIAVEVENGKYKKALNQGEYEGGRFDYLGIAMKVVGLLFITGFGYYLIKNLRDKRT